MKASLTILQRAALEHIEHHGGIRVLSRLGTLSYPRTPYRRDVVDRLLDLGYIGVRSKMRHHNHARGGIERDIYITPSGRDVL